METPRKFSKKSFAKTADNADYIYKNADELADYLLTKIEIEKRISQLEFEEVVFNICEFSLEGNTTYPISITDNLIIESVKEFSIDPTKLTSTLMRLPFRNQDVQGEVLSFITEIAGSKLSMQ
jgi:hypothetical protein